MLRVQFLAAGEFVGLFGAYWGLGILEFRNYKHAFVGRLVRSKQPRTFELL